MGAKKKNRSRHLVTVCKVLEDKLHYLLGLCHTSKQWLSNCEAVPSSGSIKLLQLLHESDAAGNNKQRVALMLARQ